jgi:20S proteasome subunit beta 6
VSINQIIAIAGKDFVMVATDTRISNGFNILSRTHSKTTQLTKKCIITSAGMVADVETLHKNLITRIRTYVMENRREPTTESIA